MGATTTTPTARPSIFSEIPVKLLNFARIGVLKSKRSMILESQSPFSPEEPGVGRHRPACLLERAAQSTGLGRHGDPSAIIPGDDALELQSQGRLSDPMNDILLLLGRI